MRIQGLLMTALLAISITSRAQTAVPDPALVESLGLSAAAAGWRYREPQKEPRALTAEQNAKVDAFLKTEASSREALAAWCRSRAVEPASAVAALLETPSAAGTAPAAHDDAAAVKEAAERGRALSASLGAAPDFDAAGHRPLDVTLRWGSAPRAEATGRNLETLYGLYGRGGDALLDKAGAGSGRSGIAARIAKAPVDLGLAWTTTLAGHELGHFEAAWLAGAKDVSWAKADGPYAFGRITEVASEDWARMSKAGRQAFNAGGTMATQAAAAALRSSMFERGEADWTQWPLMFFRKLDMTAYGLSAPAPSAAGALDGANDMTSYARLYGERSGRGGDAVHADIVRGAVWNMLDPMGLYSAYGYLGRYVVGGERTQKVPGLELGGRTWMAGTGFWLSEVGARYSMTVLSRGKKGDMIEATASTGEGQPAAAVRWSDDVGAGVRARVGVDAWSQREAAEQGPKSLGGALSVGAEKKFGRVAAYAEVGQKTTGAMLGQSHGAGTFYTIGLSGSF
ncbi:MAG: hypothetical protein NDJ72_09480 [Elusimicrobia bacterium]|nr:hypothetical protein [Elusimicrobiota bacterium]